MPRENFNTTLIHQMRDILIDALSGTEVSYVTLFNESVLARVHFMVRVVPGREIDIDLNELQSKLVDVTRSWVGDLHTALVDHFGEAQGVIYFNKYRHAFSASYREAYSPRTAIYDIEHFEEINEERPLSMNFYKPLDHEESAFRFKVYQNYSTIPLSDALPIMENMGFRVIGEQPHEVRLADGKSIWINDFNMVLQSGQNLSVSKVRNNFQSAFAAIWLDQAENDAFNHLVVKANINWRELMLLRAYARYFQQAGVSFSQEYIARTVVNNSDIARLLFDYFNLRLNPNEARDEEQLEKKEKEIVKALDKVANLDEDRILRVYLTTIKATLRSNYFQKNEHNRFTPFVSFKLDPRKISFLPKPRPVYEIYVYSPRFEGIHLRGGKVARGGLRWSDRQEDFRTEVLGLMKAQQVKNAQIVPMGAKGGFVTKKLPLNGSRDEIMREGVACYKLFIKGLLSISDNVVENKIKHPEQVVCCDDDDPYLVVAADKGTATFSDIANEISIAHGYWLGDAFASGGSVGYDHKKMGITARGAWESVKRHFREFGVDIQNADFTAVGIGDMSGDVFGNGMLLSKHTKLVAAFNHMHIFIDPDPDPQISFKERQRLFKLPRSSWSDYDESLISKGGGVFSRSAKSIKLTPEIKTLLKVKKDSLIPNELIRAILKAEIDLLWNGGIGTYVKASEQSHMEVGDKTNDAVRIDASELNCKVVGEGGNLGLTQLARIEFALRGGRLYTDFIDNAAGVDCSDHEVNIKILLNQIVAEGDLTVKQRNCLLASMESEVSALVLRDNYQQTRAISYAVNRVKNNFGQYARYLNTLVSKKVIDVHLENLPDTKGINRRKVDGKAFVAPELAVLLAYCKIQLKSDILASKLPEDSYLSHVLESEFPAVLQERFSEQMQSHMLRRDIIATQLANTVVNEMGVTFVNRLREETGATITQVVRAFTIAQVIFDKGSLLEDIDKLDLKITTKVQFSLMQKANQLVRRASRWLLRNRRDTANIESLIEHFKAPVDHLSKNLSKVLPKEDRELQQARVDKIVAKGVPKTIAQKFANCTYLFAALDIVEATTASKFSLDDVASMYFELGNKLDINWVRDRLLDFETEDYWQALARSAFRDELDTYQRMLAISVLKKAPKEKMPLGKVVDLWLESNANLVKRWQTRVTGMRTANVIESVMFSVSLRDLHDLAQANRRIKGAH